MLNRRILLLYALSLSLFIFLFTIGPYRLEGAASGRAVPRTPTAPLSANFSDSGQELGDESSKDLALGDLDGDGDLDAFVANSNAPSEIWFNQGSATGVFEDSGQRLGSGGAQSVALGDLDGDGDLDAFIVRGADLESVQVWLNQGGVQEGAQGTFLNTGQRIDYHYSTDVALADLDGDGDLDAFVTHANIADTIWFNEGDGQFSDSMQRLGDEDSDAVALGDVDGDGDVDAFVVAYPADRLWLNGGDGTDWSLRHTFSNQTRSSAIALGSVDGSGLPDAFIANLGYDQLYINRDVEDGVWGGFGSSSQNLDDELSMDVALADLDWDGDLDAFVGNYGANTVWINEDGIFSDNGQRLGTLYSNAVALGDLDGDGDNDAFVANQGPNKVWLNSAAEPPYFVNSGQALGSVDSAGVALGDLDGNGYVDAFVANGRTTSVPNRVWLNTACARFEGNGQALGEEKSLDVALGDLDGDDDLDAFVANYGPNTVWLNDGTGQFADSGQELGTEISFAVALGDLDGDGDLDAFVANTHINRVWLNGENGDPPGVFRSQSAGNSVSYDVALADIDVDGDLDALIGNSGPNGIFYNLDGAGDFVGGSDYGGDDESYGVALGDLNNDGLPDTFVANGALPAANEVWLNNPAFPGTFRNTFQSLGNGKSEAVALADLDGDADLDAFVVNNGPEQVWLNDGAAQFMPMEQGLGDDKLSLDVALADLDNDGDADAFVAVDGANRIWLNDGRGGGGACQCIVEWLGSQAANSGGNSLLRRLVPSVAGLQTLIDVNLFYQVRDQLLNQTPDGRRYVDLFYMHNAEILKLASADAALRDAGIEALSLWQPNLQALLAGNGDAVAITAVQVEAADQFLSALEVVASPDLQQAIVQERERLPTPEKYVGMTMEEAQTVTVGRAIYLPLTVGRMEENE